MVKGPSEVFDEMEGAAERARQAEMKVLREEIASVGFAEVSTRLTWLASVCHRTARANGFWTHFPAEAGETSLGQLFQRMYLATKIALIHEEGSEILRVLRLDEGVARLQEELADIIIRCLDLAAVAGGDFGQVLVDKMNENTRRPYRHGRAF